MGGMHVHDDQSLFVLGEDVDAVDLGDGVAQRGCPGRRFRELRPVVQFAAPVLLVEQARQARGVDRPAFAVLEREVSLSLGRRVRSITCTVGHRCTRSHVSQCPRQLAEHEVVNIPGVAETHFALGRMHVDVHHRRIEGEKQHEHRMATVEQHVPVGLADGVCREAILDRATVDEEPLSHRPAVRVGRQPDPTIEPHAAAGLVDRRRFGKESFPEHGANSVGTRTRGQVVQGSGARGQFERHPRIGECDAPIRVLYVRRLGPLGLQELAPGRGVVEEIGDLHRGARRMRRRPVSKLFAPGDFQAPGAVRIPPARRDGKARHGRHAGQCFAPEPHGRDLAEIRGRRDLAGGVSGHGQRHVVGVDAQAVVAHPNPLHTGLFDIDPDGRSPGVETVFHQLLDDGRRPLHDLAGGDLVRDELAKWPNASGQLPLALPYGTNSTWPMSMRLLDVMLLRISRSRVETP